MKFTISELPKPTECNPGNHIGKAINEDGNEVDFCFADILYNGYPNPQVGDVVDI